MKVLRKHWKLGLVVAGVLLYLLAAMLDEAAYPDDRWDDSLHGGGLPDGS